jgi:hypothetical protein
MRKSLVGISWITRSTLLKCIPLPQELAGEPGRRALPQLSQDQQELAFWDFMNNPFYSRSSGMKSLFEISWIILSFALLKDAERRQEMWAVWTRQEWDRSRRDASLLSVEKYLWRWRVFGIFVVNLSLFIWYKRISGSLQRILSKSMCR